MKKVKIILIFIMGIVLFSPMINTSLARQSSGVEVKADTTYKWNVRLNISNIIKLVSDTGQGTVSAELMALNLQGETDLTLVLTLELLTVPDNFGIDSFFDIETTIVEGILLIAPDYNISTLPMFYPLNYSIRPSLTRNNFTILRGNTSDYFSFPISNPLVLGNDMNWTSQAAQMQSRIRPHYLRNFGVPDSKVESRDNGLKITQPADTTIKATELNLNYNSIGILESANGKYGGFTTFSLEFSSGGSIAFELPFFLSIFVIALVTIIVRKRKKI